MKFSAKTNSKQQLEVRWDIINAYLKRWKPGTVLEIEIRRPQKTRSDPMRCMYFAGILPEFAKGLGYDPDEYLKFHEQLKIIYFGKQPKILDDLKLERVFKDKRGVYRNVPHVFHNKSKIPVEQKAEFVDWVLRKAAYEGIYIDTKGRG